MRRFIETFRSASPAKRVLFLASVIYIAATLIVKYRNSGSVAAELGVPYLVTTVLVTGTKFLAAYLLIKLAFHFRKKWTNRNTPEENQVISGKE